MEDLIPVPKRLCVAPAPVLCEGDLAKQPLPVVQPATVKTVDVQLRGPIIDPQQPVVVPGEKAVEQLDDSLEEQAQNEPENIQEQEGMEVQPAAEDGQEKDGGNGAVRGEIQQERLFLMEALPNEVLENVFAWVPLVELFASCRLVSQRWNAVISREKFLHWKKCYYQVKRNHAPAVRMVDQLMVTHNLLQGVSANTTLMRLARLVSDAFNYPDLDLPRMDEVLEKQPQYSCVEQIRQLQRKQGKDLSSLERLVLLVTSCTSVHQVLHLVLSLSTPRDRRISPALTHTQMSEIMFCLATFFYSLWVKKIFPPRFHYYVYYAMNVLERSPPTALAPYSNQDMTICSASVMCDVSPPIRPPVPLTSEQMMIVNHPYKEGQTVKVVAFAGTGKTATLVELARKYPNKKFLYCVYNKSVQQYAEKSIFGENSNVSCYTFHSLAFPCCPRGKLADNVLQKDVNIWMDHKQPIMSESLAGAVLKTLNAFFASDDLQIEEKHVDYEFENEFDMDEDDCVMSQPLFSHDDVVKQARHVWARMISSDRKDFGVKMPHDGYVKLFQLNGGIIKDWDFNKNKGRVTFDLLLVDEAQDLTPAIFAILKRQSCGKIFVGDPHQSIYGFRGAVNAIANVKADHTYYLTRSFRFGPEIAYVSSLLLNVMKNVKSETLVGGLQDSGIHGDEVGQVAIIARKNATLYEEAIKMAGSADFTNKRIAFAGKLESYKFKMLLDIYDLKCRKNTKLRTTFLRKFKSFKELKDEAAKSKDVPLQTKIQVVEKYGAKLPAIVDQVMQHNCNDISKADYVFTTAHKSKGLEFETVIVASDYLWRLKPEYGVSVRDLHRTIEDERHLVYVAATRAKRRLIMSPLMLSLVNLANESFYFPEACDDDLVCTDAVQMCIECGRGPVPDSGVKLSRKEIKLGGGSSKPAGSVCKRCGVSRSPALAF